jgi:hypothetical protein
MLPGQTTRYGIVFISLSLEFFVGVNSRLENYGSYLKSENMDWDISQNQICNIGAAVETKTLKLHPIFTFCSKFFF